MILTHISYLLPFIGLQFDNYNIQEIISNIRILQTSLEDKLHTFYQNLSEQEQSKVFFSLPQFQNCSFLNAINRSVNVSNNNSINQGLKTNTFVEKCTYNTATDPNGIFNPFCTSSPKNKKAAFKNCMLSENNKTKISEIMSKNLLEGGEYDSSSIFKSSAKIKAKFDIFLRKI